MSNTAKFDLEWVAPIATSGEDAARDPIAVKMEFHALAAQRGLAPSNVQVEYLEEDDDSVFHYVTFEVPSADKAKARAWVEAEFWIP